MQQCLYYYPPSLLLNPNPYQIGAVFYFLIKILIINYNNTNIVFNTLLNYSLVVITKKNITLYRNNHLEDPLHNKFKINFNWNNIDSNSGSSIDSNISLIVTLID